MTGSTKHIFHAFSAYVGQVTGRTTCLFWPNDPSDPSINWDPKKLIPVDLSKTPSLARAGKLPWDEVQVDDHPTNGGLTTIGPQFFGGHVIGGVWVHEEYMKKVHLTTASKPTHAHDHELRSIMYANDPHFQNRRFQGFHARVVGAPATSGTVVRLQVWNAGHGKAGGHANMWWVDLNDAAETRESAIGSKSAPVEGSLYLDFDKKQLYLAGGGTGPKLPPATGY